MGAREKTKALLRLDLPLSLLVKHKNNPNKMNAKEFDLLVDNLERTGFTDPILCKPFDFEAVAAIAKKHNPSKEPGDFIAELISESQTFEIVGGHHRFDGAEYLGFTDAPCTIIMDPDFDEEQTEFQLVRMNMIKGRLDPEKFMAMFNKFSAKYSQDILQEAFGFADEAEFKKLVSQMAKTLPDPSLQNKFKEAAAEVKTIEGLSKLLNEMFSKYGDTLPFGYMVFDHAGKRSMWLRVDNKTMTALELIGQMCIDKNRTVDDVVGRILQSIAKGEQAELVEQIVAKTPEVTLPAKLSVAPTKDNLEKVEALL